jgi:hypothetical protein
VLIPLSAERYLDSCELPGYPNVFVLGSFARHVTIYSQQVRALNLVHSLLNLNRLAPGYSVVVVGGGAAGITAAASVLLSVGGIKVTLLEKSQSVMPLQLSSIKRFVHPHIYDWPEEGSDDPNAGLPIFTWQAKEAHGVAQDFVNEWEKLKSDYRQNLVFTPGAQLLSIYPVNEQYNVGWEEKGKEIQYLQANIVILAMGFGRDVDPLSQEDYWQDNSIDQAREPSSRWFVSGTGDGGLTDLMRLKLVAFTHHSIIDSFLKMPGLSLNGVRKVLENVPAENKVGALSENFADSVRQVLRKRGIRSDTDVVLNDKNQLSEARASLLNRFIVHELHEAKYFAFSRGHIDILNLKNNNGKYEIKGEEFQIDGKGFNRILIRQGPRNDVPAEQVENLDVDDRFKEAYKHLAQRWKDWTTDHQPQEDRTRIPCWTLSDLNGERGFKVPSTTAQNRPRGACLAIVGDHTPWKRAEELAFEFTIRQAVAATKRSIVVDGIGLDSKPHIVNASDAFSDTNNHAIVVKLLCEAPVAIFDVTDLEPAVMVLLGIRAAVRRGVTVTVTRSAASPDFWAMLPFNLREVNTLSMVHPPGVGPTNPQSPIYRLSRALKDAFTEVQRQPHYSDLPGYFELRMPSSEGLIDEGKVLVLCPFDAEYLRNSYQLFLSPELQAIFNRKAVHVMSDLTSPKLLALRLYDAIRRTFFCLVDWTCWRPNVMFELGVRSAASDQITVNLINRMSPVPDKLDQQVLRLRQFFSPIEYNLAGGEGQFEIVKRLFDDYEGRVAVNHRDLFTLQDEHLTFDRAAEGVKTEMDPTLWPVEDLLGSTARGLAQHADQQPGVLFGSVSGVGQLARKAATERLLASWYFVKHRRLGLDPGDEDAQGLLEAIGNDLLARLPEDDPARREIEQDLGLLNGGD